MQRLKVMTIVGTRPEIIKLSRVIAELEIHTDHIFVFTGQNFDYELSEIFFRDLEIKKPDYFLDAAGENAAETISQVIFKADKVLALEKPDAVLIYGDTNSCLAVIAAKRRQIPVFHMEAGNRCFDQRVPEEINRKIIDHISDVNLTLSEHAKRYLLQEGIRPETVFNIGSCMQEIFNYYKSAIHATNTLEKLNLKPSNYILVSLHREENVDSKNNLINLLNMLNKVVEAYDKDIVVSTHPRTQLRLDEIQRTGYSITLNWRVNFLKPFGFFDYIQLQLNAFCILSDSGSLTEEANLLDLPAVMVRACHERPEGMDVGTTVMSGLNPSRVIQAIALVTANRHKNQRNIPYIADYQTDNVSQKVVRIILSYVDYINRTVWHKNVMASTQEHIMKIET